MSDSALETIEAILDSATDADDALRSVVQILAAQPDVAWAGVAFLEEDTFVLGPTAGIPDEGRRALATVCYKGEPIGQLRVDGRVEPAFLQSVAGRISEHVLLGWDTGGEAWEP